MEKDEGPFGWIVGLIIVAYGLYKPFETFPKRQKSFSATKVGVGHFRETLFTSPSINHLLQIINSCFPAAEKVSMI